VNKGKTSLHSKHYRLSDMLIHRKNPYVPRSKWRTSCREAQGCGTSQQTKSLNWFRQGCYWTEKEQPKCQVLNEETWGEISTKLEHSAQEVL
jgi:hypothetical protein